MTRRPTIDWGEALAFYLALGPPRSYVAVADKYGLSEGAVRHRAKAEGWPARAAEVDAKSLALVMDGTIRTSVARRVKTLRIIDGLLDAFDAKLLAKELELRVGDLPGIAKLSELLTGGPTGRVEVRELHAFMATLTVELKQLVPADKMDELADALVRAAQAANAFGGDALELEAVDVAGEEGPPS